MEVKRVPRRDDPDRDGDDSSLARPRAAPPPARAASSSGFQDLELADLATRNTRAAPRRQRKDSDTDDEAPPLAAPATRNGYARAAVVDFGSEGTGADADDEDDVVDEDEDEDSASPKGTVRRSDSGSISLRSYDSEAQEGPAHLNSNRATAAHMFISFVGAGVLGLPYAFMKTGLLGSVLVLGFVGFLATYAMMILVDCKAQLQSQGKRVRGYGDIAFGVLGGGWSSGVDFLLVLTQVAFCCAYLLFIGENLHTVWPAVRNREFIALTVPGLSLLVLLRHLKHLSPFALVADVANVVGVMVVVSSDVELFDERVTEDDPLLAKLVLTVTAANLPYFFGVAIYCYEGVGVILNIQESMQHKQSFRRVLGGTMTLVTTVYMGFGALGYLAYGDATKEIITLNLEGTVASEVVKVALSVGLFFTFPLMMFPVYTILEAAPRIAVLSTCGKSMVRVLVVLVTTLIAVGIPNFGDFISLVGAGACAILALILPAAFHLRLLGDKLPLPLKALDAFIIAVGVVLGVVGTAHAGSELVSKMFM